MVLRIWSAVEATLQAEGYRVTFEYPGFLLFVLSNRVEVSVGTANDTITSHGDSPDGVSMSAHDTRLLSDCTDPILIACAVRQSVAYHEKLFDASAKTSEPIDDTVNDPNDCPECARSYGPHYSGQCEH